MERKEEKRKERILHRGVSCRNIYETLATVSGKTSVNYFSPFSSYVPGRSCH